MVFGRISEMCNKNMICKICGMKESDKPYGICDDYKFLIISNDDIPAILIMEKRKPSYLTVNFFYDLFS